MSLELQESSATTESFLNTEKIQLILDILEYQAKNTCVKASIKACVLIRDIKQFIAKEPDISFNDMIKFMKQDSIIFIYDTLDMFSNRNLDNVINILKVVIIEQQIASFVGKDPYDLLELRLKLYAMHFDATHLDESTWLCLPINQLNMLRIDPYIGNSYEDVMRKHRQDSTSLSVADSGCYCECVARLRSNEIIDTL